jgi:hypothetical protein
VCVIVRMNDGHGTAVKENDGADGAPMTWCSG